MYSFVPSFVRSIVTLTSVCLNALYNEIVQGREEHATWINSIPLKIATLLTLHTLKLAYTFETDVLIVWATSHHYSVLRRLARRTFRGMTTSVRNVGPSADSSL